MEREYIDMHVHSNISDGTMTPEELVAYAEEKKLYAFALTDHDLVAGIDRAIEAAKQYEVKVIPGIEISAQFLGSDIHILGYGIDYKSQVLCKHTEFLQQERHRRNLTIMNRMNEMGYAIHADAFLKEHEGTSITRMHFARYLLEKGYVDSFQQAFDTLLNKGCPLYVPRKMVTVEDAISIIHEAGGKAVIAHPVLYHYDTMTNAELVEYLVRQGADGIEAIYSRNSKVDEAYYLQLARRYHLFVTGGTDYHGSNKPDLDLGIGTGNMRISKDLLKAIPNILS